MNKKCDGCGAKGITHFSVWSTIVKRNYNKVGRLISTTTEGHRGYLCDRCVVSKGAWDIQDIVTPTTEKDMEEAEEEDGWEQASDRAW